MKRLLLLTIIGLLWLNQAAAQEESAAQRPEDIESTPPAEAPATEELTTIPVPQAAPPPVEDEPQQLDELVVTAQKTRQPLRKVPISLTAIGGDFIQQTGSADLADVSLYVP